MSYFEDRLAEIAMGKPERKSGRVDREKTRHGKVVYYYREGKGKRIRLPNPDDVTEAEFNKAYDAAAKGVRVLRSRRTPEVKMMRLAGKPGHVYFVRAKSTVKIGFTTNIASRLSSIQNGNAEDLKLLMIMPGTSETEKFLHDMFRDFRIGGEWFSLTGLLADFVSFNPDKTTA